MGSYTIPGVEWPSWVDGRRGGFIPPDRRSRPRLGKATRQAILTEQRHRCFYCGIEFGDVVRRRARVMVLRPQFDHVMPFAFSQRNDAAQVFVAACQVCNGIKGDLTFLSIEDACEYVRRERFKRGYRP